MAAYAALVSLMHVIKQIQHHPHPPISLDQTLVESLTEKVTFLQDFLENYPHCSDDDDERDGLESRIADAAHAVEDIIESHVVDQILVGSTSHGERSSSIDLYEGLKKLIHDMGLIKNEVVEIKVVTQIPDRLHRNPMLLDSIRSSFKEQNFVVGQDDILIEIMDKLTGQECNRQIIPIIGMAGIGKTTLAKNVYSNPLIQHHFDIHAWATISQEYSTQEILREVLRQGNKGGKADSSESELGEVLYKHLYGRRYLIVMDDLWSIQVWDEIKFFFPDNNNGSRIIITTRLSNLASQLKDTYWLHMKFLEEDKSWNLFCKIVFGEEDCPLEMVEIGKSIVKGCRGLPLSISVIGGLLAKSVLEQKYWEYIAENLNSVVNLEDNERCLKILQTSYNQLPVYLKPCFLYVGIFPEDHRIRVSMLIDLWVAEGFLKPISGISLEEVAQKYFEDLVDRNLILVHELGAIGNVKFCIVHDLLRDFCLREAEKERFYNVVKRNSPCSSTHRRIVFAEPKFGDALQSTRLARSLFYYTWRSPPLDDFRLLRIWKKVDKHFYLTYSNSLENMFHLVNLRYFAVTADNISVVSSSLCRFWNLNTLIVQHWGVLTASSELWKMPQLRNVKFRGLQLPDPPMEGNVIVLGNLHTLSELREFYCSQEIVKRIPNIKKLRISYGRFRGASHHFLDNLDCLHKLESFYGSFIPIDELHNITFPQSLKKLTIEGFESKDIMEKIGALPLLEKLKLKRGIFDDSWETVEGQFCSLTFLRIEECYHLKYWKSESAHFPCLEHLVLRELQELKEIPLDFGEITTLKTIELEYCGDSVVISAKRIQEEQEELGNEDLQFRVRIWWKNNRLKSLASRNFQVEIIGGTRVKASKSSWVWTYTVGAVGAALVAGFCIFSFLRRSRN